MKDAVMEEARKLLQWRGREMVVPVWARVRETTTNRERVVERVILVRAQEGWKRWLAGRERPATDKERHRRPVRRGDGGWQGEGDRWPDKEKRNDKKGSF